MFFLLNGLYSCMLFKGTKLRVASKSNKNKTNQIVINIWQIIVTKSFQLNEQINIQQKNEPTNTGIKQKKNEKIYH